MKILSPIISSLAKMRQWRIDAWKENPLDVQREVLQDLVTAAQYTAFGNTYGFSKMFTIKAFKNNVPIHEYEDLKPMIERIMQGEQNVLWNTPIEWFAKSSGTTQDKSKFIPVSEESLQDCHYKAAKDMLTLYYSSHAPTDLLTGKGLVIGGSHTVYQLNEEVQFGDLSAVLLQNTPVWGNWLRTPDLSIALMDEWDKKIELLANYTIKENVTSISGVPTWTLVLLKRILEITGKDFITDVWPNLELYMHGGVSFVPYVEQFKKIMGREINYLESYNASEGFFAAQDDPNDDGMLLFLDHGIFYEWMPVSEYGKENPTTVGLADVEVGKQYAPVISTNGGLWRYLIGDTVQFTATYPFKVKVSGRLKHYINTFGEELMVDNSDKAIADASRETGCVIADYTGAPVFFSDNSNGAHEWLIEFETLPKDMNLFTKKFDEALKSANSDYEAKRQKDIALRMPIVHPVPTGSFQEWLRSIGKLGGQHKVPRLSNDRKIFEQILNFIKQNKV